MNEILLGNSIKDWMIAIGIVAGVYLVVRVFKYFLLQYLKRLAEKTHTQVDDFAIEAVRSCVVPLLYISGAYAAVVYLDFKQRVYDTAHIVLLLVFTFFVLRLITSAVRFFVFSYLDKQEDSNIKKKQARGILIIVNVVVWILGIVFLLDNLGRDVTAIIAGLGVGGIAIALAAQTILGDLFSYFVIFFDRPFEIGDSIHVDDKSGTIEYIGLKTTRIRTGTGDILIISNTNLTNSRVHNFRKMHERGVNFKITVTYDTTPEQLEAIPAYIQEIIAGIEHLRFGRCHFSSIGVASLDFDTLYYVQTPEHRVYMDKQQELYLAIFKKFQQEGIAFAHTEPQAPAPPVKGW